MSAINSQKIWFGIQSAQSCGIPMALPSGPTHALAVPVVSVAMSSSVGTCRYIGRAAGLRHRPRVRIKVRSLDGEHQQQRHEECEDPQRFCERDTDEEGCCLRSSSGRVTQGTCEVVAGHVAHPDCGCAGTDCCEACADVCEIAFHVISPYDWKFGYVGFLRRAVSATDAAHRASRRRSGS
eukprot:TRINITY_DN54503_c0_g1_i1.p1 TRINITY_DN54503_c0_g1~~TRINITY_DN54503_c0_g1_i1.p1  ORF type:complete len:181 (+),score=10.02 TRINITY_DN54503_c0_g1_i1:86-628(+)